MPVSDSVADTGLSWDQLRELSPREQPKGAQLSKEMYAANEKGDEIYRESLRRRLDGMLRDARRV